jgi:hypothetical protein
MLLLAMDDVRVRTESVDCPWSVPIIRVRGVLQYLIQSVWRTIYSTQSAKQNRCHSIPPENPKPACLLGGFTFLAFAFLSGRILNILLATDNIHVGAQ